MSQSHPPISLHDNPNSTGVDNPGPLPDLQDLPLTPEQEKEVAEILRQMHDPSSPLGGIGIALGLSKEKPHTQALRSD